MMRSGWHSASCTHDLRAADYTYFGNLELN